jgi:uncharacterized membrane protein YraQ (UPF0718 family)
MATTSEHRVAAPTEATKTGIVALALLIFAAIVLRPLASDWLDAPGLTNWATIFVAISVQAVPFLVLGVTVSGAIAAFLPPDALRQVLPRSPALAVPVAAVSGVALPGCECGSVPIAGRLISRKVAPAAALAFLLAAPAINPVVLLATALAFPGRPEVVLARFAASLVAAITVGLVWVARGRPEWTERAARDQVPRSDSPWAVFAATAQHDFIHAGGFLVIGAATAATLQTVVPRTVMDAVADAGPLSVIALAGLAFVLAICSEADAFVAAGLTQFSPTARLAFLVVGPMVDVKLVALQVGTFGRSFAVRFAPLTFVVAVASASLFGWLLL